MDLSLNGNHVLKCPNCGHEHCRVVKDGVITDIRWDQRNSFNNNTSVNTMYIPTSSVSFTAQSTFNAYISNNYVVNSNNYISITIPAPTTAPTPTYTDADRNGRSFLYGSWMNVVSTT